MRRPRARRSTLLVAALLCAACAGPFRWERREPRHTWFRAYDGPMRPASEVAIACKRDAGLSVVTIRGERNGTLTEARHERWHFPTCIEVLPGVYELTVSYFARTSDPQGRETFTTEAPPIAVEWVAAPGAYLLVPDLGTATSAPGKTYRKPKHYGAAHGNWAMGRWQVRIEPVGSLERLGDPFRQYREDWREYEEAR